MVAAEALAHAGSVTLQALMFRDVPTRGSRRQSRSRATSPVGEAKRPSMTWTRRSKPWRSDNAATFPTWLAHA